MRSYQNKGLSSVKEESYGPGMKVLNALIGAGAKLGLTSDHVDMDWALARAKRKTGLTDLGGNKHEGAMNQILKEPALNNLTHFGRIALNGMAVDAFENSLRLTEHLKRNPQIENIQIDRPIFIVGFPRTGTTLLQNLLHLADDRRGIPMWEMTNPIPWVEKGENEMLKRQKKTKGRIAVANLAVSEMKNIHDVQYDSLEECWPLMINQFMALHWHNTCRWPEYGKWFMQQDLVPTYQEYKRFLQVISDRTPTKNLVLKCPDHLWCLDALFEVFPDACVIWTHRDPGKSIPSYCSLLSLSWRLFYGKFNPEEMGPYIEERLIYGIERALESRKRLGEERFFDVNFSSLLDDPIQVVNDVTGHFKIGKIPDKRLQNYLESDRPDDHGKHSYTADYYGLDPESIRKQLSGYIEQFNLKIGL